MSPADALYMGMYFTGLMETVSRVSNVSERSMYGGFVPLWVPSTVPDDTSDRLDERSIYVTS